MNRVSLVLCFAATLAIGVAGGWILRGQREARSRPGPEPIAPTLALSLASAKTGAGAQFKTGEAGKRASLPTPPPMWTEDLLTALRDKVLVVEFRGNARDRLRMLATNRATSPLRLSIPAGQVFESANGSVVMLRAYVTDFKSGESHIDDFATLGTASSNRVADAAFVSSTATQPKLRTLLEFVADHPEIATPTAQTAALAILENLPASAFAKFVETGNDIPTQWDTTPFKVETVDIVQALMMLRQMGIPDEQLAITIDPQTKIEAMIDPLAHAVAMRHYGIQPEGEWAYWKHELLEGDPSTRHYALHGIARYYPEVALPMLPRWARESRTSPIFRTAAIQSLTETRRAEALPLLKELEHELGPETELGKTAAEAARILDTTLNRPSVATRKAIVFRMTKTPGPL